jgi:AraC-type DNA-binding domain-containing proteins
MSARTTDDGLPIRYHWFQDLVRQRKDTAATRVPLVMWADNITALQQSAANHHHDFYSLYIVRRGRGAHVIDGVAYGVTRGDVYAMRPGQTHHFEGCEGMVTDTLHFSPEIFDAATLDALSETRGFHGLFVAEPYRRTGMEGRWLHLTPAAYANVVEAIEELYAEWSSGTPSGALLTRGLFLRLLVRLAREYAATSEEPTRRGGVPYAYESTVAAAVHYLEAHFAEPVRIEQVAAEVFLSPDRFTEVFAAVMGRTPRDYLRFLRIERAKSLLAASDAPVTEVATAAGFGDPAYFARAFREAVGMSPRAYRKRNAPAR